MNTATNDPAHPFHATMTEICKGTIATVADLPGDSPARRALRQQTVADTMVSFQPHNPLETILAGQCVVFDHLVHEAARELLRGQAELLKLRARPQICASAKIFLAGLEKFEQLQARSAASLASEHTSEATGHTSEAPWAHLRSPWAHLRSHRRSDRAHRRSHRRRSRHRNARRDRARPAPSGCAARRAVPSRHEPRRASPFAHGLHAGPRSSGTGSSARRQSIGSARVPQAVCGGEGTRPLAGATRPDRRFSG